MTHAPPRQNPTPPDGDAAGFAATRWTVVLAAAGGMKGEAGSRSRRAMEELAQIYWFPLYAYIRRRGHDSAAAEDLTQEFFLRLIENNLVVAADRAQGRFRAFLLTSLKNFLANERDKAHAQKRGGGARLIALDSLDAEARYAIEPVDQMTPERVFEQRWAKSVLEQVLERLKRKYQNKEQGKLFEVLKATLTAKADEASNAAMGRELGLTPGAVGVAVHRLRRHYRDLLRDEIAQTVASPELIDEEINYLLKCL